ncbi:MAG TPA: hypothetical protein VML55_26640 [Planctomycetaceae bacterium]|nr:hypothetical protein [Planctomycetaceae bacterium]
MLRALTRIVVASAALALGAPETIAAQFYTADGAYCQCVQPVVQNVYQTVPVTEYRELRQTVQRPVVEQHWEDRQVTEYQPVTETRTAEIPTITYEDITEYRTVERDLGGWQTQYYVRPDVSPCQFDPRPGFSGWWNRTAFSVRQAITPKVTAQRYYVPNVVAETVPVVRRVARPTTRQVAYNVTRMEPYTTTRKVAVNSVRMVSEDVVRKVPVTVMRSVPIGSRVAYAVTPLGGGATATALAPTPDAAASRRAAAGSPQRSANSTSDVYNPGTPVPAGGEQPFKRRTPGSSSPAPFERDPAPFPNQSGAQRLDSSKQEDPNVRTSSFETIQPRDKAAVPGDGASSADESGFRPTQSDRLSAYPSAVRVSRTTARSGGFHAGPATGPEMTVAENK